MANCSLSVTIGEGQVLSALARFTDKKNNPEHKNTKITKGERNATLTSIAGAMRRKNAPQLAIEAALQATNKERCEPQLGQDEVSRIAQSISKYEPAKNEQDEIDIDPPISLSDLINKDIPEIEYWVDGILQKKGKLIIAAEPGAGKTLFAQNMGLAIAQSKNFMDHFSVQKGRVLFVDFEMGESALKQRFKAMTHDLLDDDIDVFTKYLSVFDLLDSKYQKHIETWIEDFNIDVLVLDPVDSAFVGDINSDKEVKPLTTYLNYLIDRFSISVVLVRHWRKQQKGNFVRREMAAGSFWWRGWADNVISLSGESHSITLSDDKQRHTGRFPAKIIGLNKTTLKFHIIGDYTKKKTVESSQLIEIFDSFNQTQVQQETFLEKIMETLDVGKTTAKMALKIAIKNKVLNKERDPMNKARKIILKGDDGPHFTDETDDLLRQSDRQ